ncbi:hypothetical protein SAMN02910298_01121 [Pseudobutyrivibrio sp. YE44]|uniref:hypothetical protein n=1 Tax=Pseudobutyrivibrio sp. YE44 TaxID=1520802 RepID=UPI00088CF433|nr:hypothetical protein [Pseudobutyrivibrio sp. YE44]SDB23023.1 hypothetical protein SAMN02910298_01121 [Pseudobutyrivibrio sp. YE44]
MVIQNSEVSMTSKSSIAREMKLTVQSETKPAINLENIQVLGDGSKIEKAEDAGAEGDQKENTIGEEGFLSSLNYALGSNGKVKEVDTENPLLNAAANRKVRLHTMEYLLKMFFLGRYIDEDSPLGQMLRETFGYGSEDYSGEGETIGGLGSNTTYMQTVRSEYFYHEEQTVEFSSTGTAITADGRRLSFNYSFAMSESFTQEFSEEYEGLKYIHCIDPLVINLDDCPTSIADQTFLFDLDGDGELDDIHNIGKGSGFLALDKNEDGEINDGMELFGAKTGDGFGELAEYDSDGNGWIDENDPVFAKLRIMTVTENGERQLFGLKESDVGAIFLGRIDTDMMKRGDDQKLSAEIRKSGIFLHEKDGHAGGVQHVDFAT